MSLLQELQISFSFCNFCSSFIFFVGFCMQCSSHLSSVLSRLGHMSYDVVGTQILQTGIPISKANLIGTTEISIASLAEFAMLGVAIIANDVRHFSFLALLSFSSVVGAASMFCCWLGNPSDEQRELFSPDRQIQTDGRKANADNLSLEEDSDLMWLPVGPVIKGNIKRFKEALFGLIRYT